MFWISLYKGTRKFYIGRNYLAITFYNPTRPGHGHCFFRNFVVLNGWRYWNISLTVLLYFVFSRFYQGWIDRHFLFLKGIVLGRISYVFIKKIYFNGVVNYTFYFSCRFSETCLIVSCFDSSIIEYPTSVIFYIWFINNTFCLFNFWNLLYFLIIFLRSECSSTNSVVSSVFLNI